MAENILVVEIYPDSDETNLDDILKTIKKKLPDYAELMAHKTEPYFYGLNKLVLRIKVPEKEGLADEIEQLLSSIEGISAEVVRMGRL